MKNLLLTLSNDLYTGIWWYAAYPNHYASVGGEVASIELGKLLSDLMVKSLVNAIKEVKNDDETLRIQNEYFDKVKN